MIIGKNKEGKAVLLRCECSHRWSNDLRKYGSLFIDNDIKVTLCQKCDYYGWRITGMTDEELLRREID